MHQQRAQAQNAKPRDARGPCILHTIGARFPGCCIIMVRDWLHNVV